MTRRTKILSLLLTLAATTGVAFAAEVKPNEVMTKIFGGDRYVFGQIVSLDDESPKDVMVLGTSVSIASPVTGTVQAAGRTVVINAPIKGGARIGAETVEISKNIDGNLIVVGKAVHIAKNVVIGGSVLLFSGESAVIDGTINGNLEAYGEAVSLNGAILGNADIQVQSLALKGTVSGDSVIAAETFDVEPSASIEKNLRYWQALGVRDFGAMVKGKSTFDPTLAHETSQRVESAGLIAGVFAAFSIFSIFSAALMLGLLLFFTKTLFRDSAKFLLGNTGKSFLIGIIYFLVTPIAALLLMFTFIGIPLGLAVFVLYVVSIFFARIMTAMVFARLIELKYKKKWSNMVVFFVSLGLYIALKIIGAVPFGWVVLLVLVAGGYGSLLKMKYERYVKVM